MTFSLEYRVNELLVAEHDVFRFEKNLDNNTSRILFSE